MTPAQLTMVFLISRRATVYLQQGEGGWLSARPLCERASCTGAAACRRCCSVRAGGGACEHAHSNARATVQAIQSTENNRRTRRCVCEAGKGGGGGQTYGSTLAEGRLSSR